MTDASHNRGRRRSCSAFSLCSPFDDMERFRPGRVSRVSYAHVTSTTWCHRTVNTPCRTLRFFDVRTSSIWYDDWFSRETSYKYTMILTTIVTTKLQYALYPYYYDMMTSSEICSVWLRMETQVDRMP